MRAMILAAGRGERLRPLTETVPKPLIEIGGKPLIEYHLDALARSGFREVVINQGHLGDLLRDRLGEGARWGLTIRWSDEQPDPLETGGGIVRALPLLGPSAFLVVNGDVCTDFPFSRLRAVKCDWAHLVLVPNPAHNPEGDFCLEGARVRTDGVERVTFGGIAVYHPRMFANCEPGRFSVVPLLREAMERELVTGELYRGRWTDIGTPDGLRMARELLQVGSAGNGG